MADGVFFDIAARLIGMEGVATKMVKDGTAAGEQTGKAMSESLSQWVTAGTGSMTASMERQISAATATLERASAAVVKSKDIVADASGRVMVAEAKENEARLKYAADSSKYIAAYENLERVKRQQVAASAEVVAATNNEARAQEALIARQDTAVASSAAATGTAATALKGAALIGFGAVAIGAAEATKSAGDFQESQVRLVTSAGLSKDALTGVSDGILNLAGQVGVSAEELSKGAYTVSSGMVHQADATKDAANALSILKAASEGAKQEGAEVGTVADAVTTILRDYHQTGDQAADVTSKLVTAISLGKTQLEPFSEALHNVTPMASTMGVSIADVTGTLAEMTAHGVPAAQASQNLASAMRSLQNAQGPARQELESFGITATQLNDSIGERGVAGTLQWLSESVMKKMGPDGKVLLDSFHSSTDAAHNLDSAIGQLNGPLKDLAVQFNAGDIGVKEFTKGADALGGENRNTAKSIVEMKDKAEGFTTTMKNGGAQSQSYTTAMTKLLGTVEGVNTAFMVTKENGPETAEAIKKISESSGDAEGNVKGWEEVQGNFNQKLAEFKDGIGAVAIKIGTDLLPAATSMVGGLKDVSDWLGNNKWAVDTFLIAIGGAAAAFAVWKTASATWTVISLGIEAATWAMGGFAVAETGATAGATGLAAALAATGISEIVIGVAALVAGLIALGAGVKYAYDHWGWFHDAIQTSWETLKSFGSWIGGVFVAAWHGIVSAVEPVQHAFGNVMHALDNVGHAVGNVLNVLKYAGAIVATVIAVPFVLAFKVAETAVMAFWHQVVEPAMHAIGDIFNWVYNSIIKPVIGFIKDEITGWGIVMSWVYDSIIKPVMDKIGDIWHWLYDTIIKPIIGFIKGDIQAAGDVFNWLHDHVIKPVGDKIGDVFNNLKTTVTGFVEMWKTEFEKIANIVAVPVNYIINTVYNDAIRPVWNGIAHVFSLDEIPEHHFDIAHYAGGGIHQGPGLVPGYAPGQDTVNAKLSPGEGVAVPELVQAIGPSNFLALNHMYSGGRRSANGAVPGFHFDIGGIFSGIGDVVGDAWSGITDAAGLLAKVAKDPVGAVKDLFHKATDLAQGSPGDHSLWRDALVRTPEKFVGGAIEKVKGWLGMHPGAGSGAGGNEAWVSGAGAEQWVPIIVQALAMEGFPTTPEYIEAAKAQIMTESGGNPNIIQTVQDVNSGGNEAEGLVQVTPQTAAGLGLSELGGNLYDPLTNLRLGLRRIKSGWGGDLLGTWGHGHGYAGGGIAGLDSLIGGDYTGNFLGQEEDSPAVAGILGMRSLLAKGDYTSNLRSAFGVEEDDPAVRAALAMRSLVGQGDYTDDVRNTFGIEEDNPLVGGILGGRKAVLDRFGGQWADVVARYHFAGGGIMPGGTAKNAPSGPELALQQVKDHLSTMYAWGGGDLSSGVDCSGLVADAQLIAMGQSGDHRLGTTETMLAGQWPNLLPGASPSDIFAIGTNADHMAATILGTNIEARQSGEHIRYGSDAVGAFDSQFTKQFHVDPAVFNPAYQARTPDGSSNGGLVDAKTQDKITDLQNKAKQAQDAAEKDLADAAAADAAVTKDLADAADAEADAAKAKTDTDRQKKLAAADKYRANADQQKATAKKNRDDADIQKQKAQQFLDEAKNLQSGDTSSSSRSSSSSSSSSGSSSTEDKAPVPMSVHDFGSKLGGIAADGVMETFGIPDLTASPFFKIPATIANAFLSKPGSLDPANWRPKPITPDLHDDGGFLPQGLSLNYNGTPRRERVLSPEEEDLHNRVYELVASGQGGQNGPMMHIEHLHAGEDYKAGARTITREMNSYPGPGPR